MQTWTFDVPTGVYKNHTLSGKIRNAALAEAKFMQFVDPEPGYGKGKGESITIKRISNLAVPTNARLTEGVKIPEDQLAITTIAITVSEWGRSVPFTSLAEDLDALNLRNVVQKALKDQMKLVLDAAAAEQFKAAQIKVIFDGVASIEFDTDGIPTNQSTANWHFFHVEQMRDFMFSTLNVPPFLGDDYMCLISTTGKRGLVTDPRWENWKKYTDPAAKFNAEIGRIENIRFVEINNTSSLSGSKGLNGIQGEGVIFGQDAVAIATAHDPELRAKLPGDYGREQGVAWYGILEFGIIWDTSNPGEARILHITSS